MSFRKLITINLVVLFCLLGGGWSNNSSAQIVSNGIDSSLINSFRGNNEGVLNKVKLENSYLNSLRNYNEFTKSTRYLTVKNDLLQNQITKEEKQDELKKEFKNVLESVKNEQQKKFNKEKEKERQIIENNKKQLQMEMAKKNQILYMEATAYTAFCNTGCTGVTATGINVANTTTYQGMCIIAVDPKVLPLGSVVLVDGKKCVAADTGGDIKGHRIDILMSSTSEAYRYGRQFKVKVEKIGSVQL